MATRKLSETVLSKIHAIVPELIGGSSDLTPSNLTRWASAVDFQAPGLEDVPGDYSGRYLRYGVREHAMGAIMNGLAAYRTVLPYSGTFLNFCLLCCWCCPPVCLVASSGHLGGYSRFYRAGTRWTYTSAHRDIGALPCDAKLLGLATCRRKRNKCRLSCLVEIDEYT